MSTPLDQELGPESLFRQITSSGFGSAKDKNRIFAERVREWITYNHKNGGFTNKESAQLHRETDRITAFKYRPYPQLRHKTIDAFKPILTNVQNRHIVKFHSTYALLMDSKLTKTMIPHSIAATILSKLNIELFLVDVGDVRTYLNTITSQFDTDLYPAPLIKTQPSHQFFHQANKKQADLSRKRKSPESSEPPPKAKQARHAS